MDLGKHIVPREIRSIRESRMSLGIYSARGDQEHSGEPDELRKTYIPRRDQEHSGERLGEHIVLGEIRSAWESRMSSEK